MTDRTCVNLIENNTKLSYPIRLGIFFMKTKYDNDITIRIGAAFIENDTDFRPGVICDKN